MRKIEEPVEVEARLAWALIWIAVIIFLFALLWGMLNPHMQMMRDTGGEVTNETAGPSPAAQKGWWAIMTVWGYAPLWVAAGALFYGYRRAINESKRYQR